MTSPMTDAELEELRKGLAEAALEAAARSSYEYEGDRKGISYVGWDREPEEVKREWRESCAVVVATYLKAWVPPRSQS